MECFQNLIFIVYAQSDATILISFSNSNIMFAL